MRVTFEIEIDDALVNQLDYYVNYGGLGAEDAGCKKCIFNPMCSAWVDTVAKTSVDFREDCKFPCWLTRSDRQHGTDRKVFVLNPNNVRGAEHE